MALAGHPRAMKMTYFHTRAPRAPARPAVMKIGRGSSVSGSYFQMRAPRAPARPAVMKRAGRNAADGVYFQAREGLFCPVKWPLKGANYHPKNCARKRTK